MGRNKIVATCAAIFFAAGMAAPVIAAATPAVHAVADGSGGPDMYHHS